MYHILQGCDTHHEKFVQIAGKNGNEFQPFQERDQVVGGLLQHPAVEPKPAQLPVLGVTVIIYDAFKIFWHKYPSLTPY